MLIPMDLPPINHLILIKEEIRLELLSEEPKPVLFDKLQFEKKRVVEVDARKMGDVE